MRNVTKRRQSGDKRAVRWNIIGVAISLLIVVLAFAILLKLLQGIELARSSQRSRQQPLREVFDRRRLRCAWVSDADFL